MRRLRGAVLGAACTLALVLPFIPSAVRASGLPSLSGLAGLLPAAVCRVPVPGFSACRAEVLTRAGGVPYVTPGPGGYGPPDFQSAYNLPTGTAVGSGHTVALIDAFDDPSAEADLGVYRSSYGLAPCTTANGCFRKVDLQTGVTPTVDPTWALEESLDVQAVSAACPNCHILLVEAVSQSNTALMAALHQAVALGATEISNSYGSPESGAQQSSNQDGELASHPGIPITVSSGDSANAVDGPATSPAVTAVGGTTLTRASNARGWSEVAWTSAGSGCSAYEAQPSWQAPVGTACPMRAVADVSADADPSTGASVYDSVGYNGSKGWMVVGGTSLASPLIAGVYALAGNGSSVQAGSYPYAHTASLNPVPLPPTGSAGGGLLGSLGLGGLLNLGGLLGGLCLLSCHSSTGPAYNGPAGLGSPNGTGAF